MVSRLASFHAFSEKDKEIIKSDISGDLVHGRTSLCMLIIPLKELTVQVSYVVVPLLYQQVIYIRVDWSKIT